MLKNYHRRERHTIVGYSLNFMYDSNSGCSFPCDPAGNVTISELSECAVQNLLDCTAHPERFTEYAVVEREERKVTDPAHGTCECGREVYLYNQFCGACECECGRWYNLFGQEVASPEQWSDGEDW